MTQATVITFLAIALSVSAISPASGRQQSEAIQLTNPEDIREASTMDQAIVRLSGKVTECVQGKLAPASRCFCLYPQELSHFRKTYEGTMRRHPAWKSRVVSYTLDGRTHAVSFGGLNRQLRTKCPQGK